MTFETTILQLQQQGELTIREAACISDSDGETE
jgi:hypothetical protein